MLELNLIILLFLIFIETLFFGEDIIGTIETIVLLKKWRPKKDPTKFEMNHLLRFLWKKKGLKTGTTIAILIQYSFIVFFVIFFWVVYINLSFWFLGLLLGGQAVAIRIHEQNIEMIKNKLKKKNRKIYKQ